MKVPWATRAWVAGAVGTALGLAALAGWNGEWAHGGWFACVPMAALAAAVWELANKWKTAARDVHRARAFIAAGCLWAAFCLWTLPGTRDPTGWFVRWWPAHGTVRQILASGLFHWTLIALLVWWAERRGDLLGGLHRASWVPAIIASLGALVVFLTSTAGRPLYGDDHPSFLFRLWTWTRSCPWPVAWVPFWNAGTVDASPAASGLPLLGWLYWPLRNVVEPHRVYTWIVAAMLTILVPLLAGWSVARLGGGRIAQGTAALLALVPAQGAILWSLHFGTVPSVLSAACSMPLLALLVQVWRNTQFVAVRALGLGLAAAAYLTWPAATIPATTLGIGLLASPRHAWLRWATWLLAGAVAAILLVPNLVGLLNGSHVAQVVAVHPARNIWAEWLHGWQRGFSLVRQTHPLLVFVGILGGLWGVAGLDESVRYWVRWTLVGWLAWAMWGEMIWPELQLGRASVALTYMAVLPTALAVEEFLVRREGPSILRALLISLWIVTVPSAVAHFGSRLYGSYRTMPAEIEEMASWIHHSVPEGARVLWAGATVHGVGGGHVAYLPVLAGRPMMACDYYHFSPRQVEYNYPPRAFRKTPRDVFEFLDLYNVGLVMTLDETWKRFFRSHADQVEELAAFGRSGRIAAFRLKRPAPGQFLNGHGHVVERVNGLDVTVEDPSQPVVLRYNWDHRLFVSPPAELRPFPVSHGVQLIQLHPRGQRTVCIRWSPFYHHKTEPTLSTASDA